MVYALLVDIWFLGKVAWFLVWMSMVLVLCSSSWYMACIVYYVSKPG
ncbi:hypothetical protein J2S05_004163 [Alkalicoccobacillus murimartini]|uniref:Uncharacterized protein n=1 Tax=Alkalicoccobacillus murimartini TaxID=171685 RepID=A0ABT9YNH7_9BACI|nr:hypothetical protein [Alkalicoccobacillus murimartini]